MCETLSTCPAEEIEINDPSTWVKQVVVGDEARVSVPVDQAAELLVEEAV